MQVNLPLPRERLTRDSSDAVPSSPEGGDVIGQSSGSTSVSISGYFSSHPSVGQDARCCVCPQRSSSSPRRIDDTCSTLEQHLNRYVPGSGSVSATTHLFQNECVRECVQSGWSIVRLKVPMCPRTSSGDVTPPRPGRVRTSPSYRPMPHSERVSSSH